MSNGHTAAAFHQTFGSLLWKSRSGLLSLCRIESATHLFRTSCIFKFFIKQLTYCNQLCRTVEQQWKKMHEKHSSDEFKYRSIQISLKKGNSFQNLHAQQSQAYTCIKEKHNLFARSLQGILIRHISANNGQYL